MTKSKIILKSAISILIVLFVFTKSFSITENIDTTLEANFEFDNACIFQLVQFTDLSSGNIDSWNWNFDNGVGFSNEQFPEFSFSGSGTFTVELIVSNQFCADTLLRIVEISNSAPTFRDTVVCNNEEVKFNGITYSEFVGSTTVFNRIDTFISSQGCDSISILRMTVNPCDCYLTFPNVFTPNGDEINDTYQPVIVCDEEIVDYWMIIYDRWGETVFETFNPRDSWDGKINGRPMPMDVFVVWVRYEIANEEERNYLTEVKDVTLIR